MKTPTKEIERLIAECDEKKCTHYAVIASKDVFCSALKELLRYREFFEMDDE